MTLCRYKTYRCSNCRPDPRSANRMLANNNWATAPEAAFPAVWTGVACRQEFSAGPGDTVPDLCKIFSFEWIRAQGNAFSLVQTPSLRSNIGPERLAMRPERWTDSVKPARHSGTRPNLPGYAGATWQATVR